MRPGDLRWPRVSGMRCCQLVDLGCFVQHGSNELHVAVEHLQCAWPDVRCIVNVKYTLGFEDSVTMSNVNYDLIIFYIDYTLKQ